MSNPVSRWVGQRVPSTAVCSWSAGTPNYNISLVEPTGALQGDLLVAVFTIRGAFNSWTLPTGWAWAVSPLNGNVEQEYYSSANPALSSSSGGAIAYIVRGASAPALSMSMVGVDNLGLNLVVAAVLAYTDAAAAPFASGVSGNTNGYTTSAGPFSTTGEHQLVIAALCGARSDFMSSSDARASLEDGWILHSGQGTKPLDPSTLKWSERLNTTFTTSPHAALSVYDLVVPSATTLGTVSIDVTTPANHALVVAAFKPSARAGAMDVEQAWVDVLYDEGLDVDVRQAWVDVLYDEGLDVDVRQAWVDVLYDRGLDVMIEQAWVDVVYELTTNNTRNIQFTSS